MNIKISPTITLTPLQLDDSGDILQLINASRTHLAKYLYWVDGVTDLTSCQHYIDQRINSGLPNAQWYAIYFKLCIVGIFTVKSIDKLGVAELGYWLSHSSIGHGIINTIIDKVPTVILNNTPATAFEICCLTKNVASIKVAIKSGAAFSHAIEEFMVHDGSMQALNVYRKSLV